MTDLPNQANAAPGELQALREQREQALACFWLALTVAVALPLSIFGDRGEAATSARQTIEVHRKLVAEADGLLRENEKALQNVQQALQNVRAARRR
jgi:hypothetical protein